jgi:hypothetical protein
MNQFVRIAASKLSLLLSATGERASVRFLEFSAPPSLLPVDGDRRLPQEWRDAREGRGDGEPPVDAHDTALRSSAR